MIPRARWLAAAVALAALAGPAVASQSPDDSGMNLHQVYLPLDGRGFYVVDEPATLEQWQVHGFLNYSHAYRPLEAGSGRSSTALRTDIVDRQDMIDLGASVGLLPKEGYGIRGLSVGVDLPINIVDDGLRLPNLDASIGSGGVGALRLQAKADLLELAAEAPRGERPFWELALGAKPFLTLPTGRTRDYLNDRDTATWGAMVEAMAKVWRVRLGLEGGYEFTPHIVLGDLSVRDRVRWGSALEVLLLDQDAFGSLQPDEEDHRLRHTAAIGCEAWGWSDAFHFFGDNRTRPVEGFGYLKYENSWGLLFSVGYGWGINHGVSAAQDRFMVRVGWTF